MNLKLLYSILNIMGLLNLFMAVFNLVVIGALIYNNIQPSMLLFGSVALCTVGYYAAEKGKEAIDELDKLDN